MIFRIILCSFIIGFCFHQKTSAQCIDSTQISPFTACEDTFWPDQFEAAYNPVCGCDGKTYFTAFCAYNNGVTEWTPGPCDPCFDTLRDNRQSFHFLAWGGFTHFIDLPRTQVCGCDGKTYLNPYTAFRAGNTQWDNGSCSCIDSSVIDLSIDFDLCEQIVYEKYQDLFLREDVYKRFRYLKGCDGKFYNSFCEAYHRHGVTRFVSLWEDDCLILPVDEHENDYPCNNDYNPVCGCNWITYQNACVAEKHHGIIEYYEGECDCVDESLIGVFNNFQSGPPNGYCPTRFDHYFLNAVCGCDGNVYFNYCYAVNQKGIPTYTDCSCIREDAIDLTHNCDSTFLNPVCGCDGKVYRSSCDAFFKNGVTSLLSCNCIEEGLIDPNTDCNELFDWDPVCGCDGRTYPNSCSANLKYGVIDLRKGACESTCKDSILILEEVPCSDAYYPVCGCDLITYQNECHARYKNGVLKWTEGPCTLSSAEHPATEINVSIFPNPSSGKLYLSGISNHDYLIMDSRGRIVQQGKQQPTLDITDMPAGLYIIRLFHENNSFKSFKIIKT